MIPRKSLKRAARAMLLSILTVLSATACTVVVTSFNTVHHLH